MVIAIGIDKGIAARPVSVGSFGERIIVTGVAVLDVGPDFGNGGVGPDNHFITGTANGGVSATDRSLRIGHRAAGSLGVVVEGLGEGLVEWGLGVAFEEGAGAENMEAIF